jgi:hypothetical protein
MAPRLGIAPLSAWAADGANCWQSALRRWQFGPFHPPGFALVGCCGGSRDLSGTAKRYAWNPAVAGRGVADSARRIRCSDCALWGPDGSVGRFAEDERLSFCCRQQSGNPRSSSTISSHSRAIAAASTRRFATASTVRAAPASPTKNRWFPGRVTVSRSEAPTTRSRARDQDEATPQLCSRHAPGCCPRTGFWQSAFPQIARSVSACRASSAEAWVRTAIGG